MSPSERLAPRCLCVTMGCWSRLWRGRKRPLSGLDAYESLEEKAGALLHSLARNHALVDGNKRLALAATIAFMGLNGYRLTLTNDEAYTLVIEVASGLLDDVADIADRIRRSSAPRAK